VLQVGAAVLLGLTLAVGAAVVMDRSDRRLRSPGRLASVTGAPVLAALARPRVKGARRLVLVSNPGSRLAEAYRFLRAQALDPQLSVGATTVVVTCADDRDREARDVVLANLAAAATETGCSVAVVADPASRQALEAVLGADLPQVELLEALPRGERPPGDAPGGHGLMLVLAAPVMASAQTVGHLRQGAATILVADTRCSDRESVRQAFRLAGQSCPGPVWTVLTRPCSARRAGVRQVRPRPVAATAEATPAPLVPEEAGQEGLA
jgi:hypothetical protein